MTRIGLAAALNAGRQQADYVHYDSYNFVVKNLRGRQTEYLERLRFHGGRRGFRERLILATMANAL